MNPIINMFLNKHFIPWEVINFHLIHTSGSVVKEMFHHQTITSLPKILSKKINQAPWKIFYTAKITTFPHGTNVETTNFPTGELIHMYLIFYNVNSIRGFNYMLTEVCEKTRIIFVFTTA